MDWFKKAGKPATNGEVQNTPGPTVVRANEVFTPSAPATRGFVGRTQEMKDLRQKGFNVPGTQIAIWGESGAGKTSLVNKVLENVGRTAVKTACTPDSTYEAILASAFSGTGAFYVTETTGHTDVSLSVSGTVGSELIGSKFSADATYEAGKETTRQPLTAPQLTPERLVHELGKRKLSWVIEDFHKVAQPVRMALGHALKVFSDDGTKYPDTTIIVLGVSESVDELVKWPTNVGKRLIDIKVPPLGRNELGEILTTGENLLNVDFGSVTRDRLITFSAGTAGITHALALSCCDERDVEETSPATVTFSEEDFAKALEGYRRTRSGDIRPRFLSALKVHRTRKYKNTEVILHALTQVPEDGGTVAEILAIVRKTYPIYPTGNLTKYLDELQEDERGALVRKTSTGRYRFDEPLSLAYAHAYYADTGWPASEVNKNASAIGESSIFEMMLRVLADAPGTRVDTDLLRAQVASIEVEEDDD